MCAQTGSGGFIATNGVSRTNSQIVGPANVNTPQQSWNGDGTATFKNSAGSTVADTPWGLPAPQTGIGVFYWIRLTNVAGTGVYNGVVPSAAWNSMSAGLTFGINAAGPGLLVSRSGSYEIASDGAGANIVASGAYAFTSDRT